MLIMLWFFGVTVFHFGPQALLGGDTFMANVLTVGKYEAKIGEEVIDSNDTMHKSDAARACAGVMQKHQSESVICTWRGRELQVVGLLLNR